jgi:hypothetical protein
MRYMLLIYGCARSDWAPAQEAKRAAVRDFTEHCRSRGVFLAADPLLMEATSVEVREGEAIVTDGPFTESNELLGGYYLLDCRDLDEAVELAGLCPMAAEGRIEVRPVMELPEFDQAPAAATAASSRRS